MSNNGVLKVGVGGLGAIGMAVARRLDQGLHGLELGAVSASSEASARTKIADLQTQPAIVPLSELGETCDIVVECAPAAVFDEIAAPAVRNGRVFIPISCGQLLPRMGLIEEAHKSGAQIIVPTGALIGLDAVRAAAEGIIHSVRIVTRKPPNGLAGAPHLEKNKIDVSNVTEPKLVFSGNARAAAIGFPANVNVAAALSLAGIGPDETEIEIWADPTVDRNTHTIHVDSESASFEMTMRNIPSAENPKTGRITPQSVIATLANLRAPLRVGC